MEWLRWYQGTINNPKWRVVAADSGQPLVAVLAVWAAILEHASQTDPRGTLSGWRPKVVAAALDLSVDAVQAIHDAMQGMVLDGEQIVVKRGRPIYNRVAAGLRPEPAEWAAIRAKVFQRDDYTCTYCGARGGRLECDHVHPVARGGGHELTNLTTACFPCNRDKRDKTLSEWKGGLN